MNFRLTLILLITMLGPGAIAFGSGGGSPDFGSIRGTVVDAQENEVLPGASIRLDDGAVGFFTDAQGIFEIANLTPGRHLLLVSFLGYATDTFEIEILPGNAQKLDIYLSESEIALKGMEINAGNKEELSLINKLDLQMRPVNSSQELLRAVPGLFIAQHAGGGKAEQIFLRGFDIDHGTDLALSVDGMPVNMVSHAHGQGYADLHFVIPETVERLEIFKGPYEGRMGNLATAGSVNFQTINAPKQNMVKLEAGSFNTFRGVVMLRPGVKNTRSNAADTYLAAEYLYSKGYFESPQAFNRINVFAKYRKLITRNTLFSASLSGFTSQWNASGQIPQRAVDQGLITRWGSIDPTEGGQTSRVNANLQLTTTLPSGSVWKNQAYATRYAFDLYSNFTFYANDPVNGDQIRQLENRWMYGYQTQLTQQAHLAGRPFTQEYGAGFRKDNVLNSGLYRTIQRTYLGAVQDGSIQEMNAFAWTTSRWHFSPRWIAEASVRMDAFSFAYQNNLEQNEGGNVKKAIVNPRVKLDYFATDKLQIFARTGSGFHSNDSRFLVAQQDLPVLPRALGTDIGALFKPSNAVLVQVAVWGLAMEQEFVYVGDEGIVEPSGRSRRVGVDMSARYQINTWLMADVDVNLAHARMINESGGMDYIPLAPWITASGGLNANWSDKWKANMRFRYLGDRAADESADLIAKGYFLLDGAVNYAFLNHYSIGFSFTNLFNTRWNEAQFATTSRLQNEPASVTEIHFTPGSPRSGKITLTCNF